LTLDEKLIKSVSMKKKKTEKTPSVKISKSQIRKIPKLVELYKIINT